MEERALKHRILVVDDEPSNRKLLKTVIESLGHAVELAEDGPEALLKLQLGVDAVLLDVMLPGLDGYEVARRIRQKYHSAELPVLMVTALSSKEDRIRAVKAGADDFVTKPIERFELSLRLQAALSRKRLHDELQGREETLQQRVLAQTESLRKALEQAAESQRKTQTAYLQTIHCLAVASGYKDEDTAQHINRISGYCRVIAQGMSLSPGEVNLLELASPMHDVGKIGIPDAILLKPGKLNPEEWRTMKEHTLIGAEILSHSNSELLDAGRVIALTHHEKWDGSGYPNGLKGAEIPLWSRICAVADVFDALTSERPYKKAFSTDKAFEILREGRGNHFDPDCLDVFFAKEDEILRVKSEYVEREAMAESYGETR